MADNRFTGVNNPFTKLRLARSVKQGNSTSAVVSVDIKTEKQTGGNSPFDQIRHTDDQDEYWSARELQELLGYDKWERFEDVIGRAKGSCRNMEGEDGVRINFPDAGKNVKVGFGYREVKDYHLTRYACYLIAMNGDPRKTEIAAAKQYFVKDYSRLKEQESVKQENTLVTASTSVNSNSPFDAIKHIDVDGEYWLAKELQTLLGYQGWDKFKNVIEKGKQTCTNVGEDANYHIRQAAHMIEIGKGAKREVQDYRLTRYACYVIAMNGDSSKQEIAAAQTYFAVKTRQAEVHEQKLPAMSTMEMISTIALHVDKVEKEQKRQADILQQQQKQQQEIAAAVEEQTVRLNRLEQNTVTIRNFAPPDEDVKKSINDRVKALAFNRKEKEGDIIKTHVTDIWSDIYRELRSLGCDLDEELASFKDFWTSQKNRGNKMFTQGKINGFNRLDVVSAVPDIRSMVRTILDRLQDDLEKAEDNGLY